MARATSLSEFWVIFYPKKSKQTCHGCHVMYKYAMNTKDLCGSHIQQLQLYVQC